MYEYCLWKSFGQLYFGPEEPIDLNLLHLFPKE